MGTPMEWLPPSTRDTVGLLKDAIISAIRLHVAAHGVKQYQDAVNVLAVLNGGKLRQDMLVLGGLRIASQIVMPLHFSDNRDQMNIILPAVLIKSDLSRLLDSFASMLLFFHFFSRHTFTSYKKFRLVFFSMFFICFFMREK